jgi:hypothetical protein
VFLAVHIFLHFHNFYYVGFFLLLVPFFTIFWEHTSNLNLPFGDAVNGWLAVSLFSYPIFTILLWQWIVPKLYLRTGTVSDLITCILLFTLNPVSKTKLTLLRLCPVSSNFQSTGFEPQYLLRGCTGNIELSL